MQPPVAALGVKVMSMDLLLASDATPLAWQAPTQSEAHTWRGSMEAQAVREFLADTEWGDLDALVIENTLLLKDEQTGAVAFDAAQYQRSFNPD